MDPRPRIGRDGKRRTSVAQKSFHCKLVTPTAALFNDRVTYASVPAWDGLMGFLPGRAPLLGRLGTGELRLEFADSEKTKGGSRSFVISGGIIRMDADHMTILAEDAFPAEELTVSGSEGELKAAKDQRSQDLARAKLTIARRGGGI